MEQSKLKNEYFFNPEINQVSKELLPESMQFFKWNIVGRILQFILQPTLIFPLLCQWFEGIWVSLNLVPTDNPMNASQVKIVSINKKTILSQIQSSTYQIQFLHLGLKWVWNHQDAKFHVAEQTNHKLKRKVEKLRCSDIRKYHLHGVNEKDAEGLLSDFGLANIHVPEKNCVQLFFEEVFSPFNIFQAFSVLLWFSDGYWKQAIVIFFTMMWEVIVEVRDVMSSNKKISQMVQHQGTVEVFREANFKEAVTVSSDQIQPGDVVKILPNSVIPADLLIIHGKAVVSEAMLTGESVPLVKEAIPTTDCHPDVNKHQLYYGSNILFADSSTHNYAIGLVVCTNQLTIRGGLIRSILYPNDLFSDFQRDSYIVILCMFILAMLGFSLTMPALLSMQTSPYEMIDKCLDLITVAVPPALPLALSFGMTQSLHRILNSPNKIFCTRPQKIVEAGSVDSVVFDKTGTLTDDSMICDKIVQYNQFKIGKGKYDAYDLYEENPQADFKSPFIRGMASCNSIVLLDAKVQGDPMEQELLKKTEFKVVADNQADSIVLCRFHRESPIIPFENLMSKSQLTNDVLTEKISTEATDDQYNQDAFIEKCENKPNLEMTDEYNISFKKNYDIDKGEHSRKSSKSSDREQMVTHHRADFSIKDINSIDIVKRFDFDSNLARMSVVVGDVRSKSKFMVYTKGSPESISNVCIKESLPKDYFDRVNQQAKLGQRVLAQAFKDYKKTKGKNRKVTIADINKIERGFAESDLVFCGFVVLKNKLKDSTRDSIQQLNHAKINVMMATGDHLLTAVAVGRECDIIQKLVVGRIKFNFPKLKHIHFQFGKIILDKDSIKDQPIEQTIKIYYDNYIEEYQSLHSKCNNNSRISDDQEFAIEGEDFMHLLAYREHNLIEPNIFLYLLNRMRVQARMKPDHKAKLVSSVRTELDSVVGMCGDGANDCAALKEANVGLSLSEAEASIAAPFTSGTFQIDSFVLLLREGRCALVTSFQCFKWIAMYSLIQFVSVSLLYISHTNMTDNQFLQIDLIIIIPLVYFMSWSKPAGVLNAQKPERRLFSFSVIGSILVQTAIQFLFQFVALYLMKKDPGFIKIDILMAIRKSKMPHLDDVDMENLRAISFETTAVFLVANYQQILTNIIQSAGYPFKEPNYKNFWLLFWLVLIITSNIFILGQDFKLVQEDFYQMMPIGVDLRIQLGILVIVNQLVSQLGEKGLEFALKRLK